MFLQFLLFSFFFILSIGILITIHELGHFIFARCYGVMVERFSIGFGKTLFHWKDKYNTVYSISIIPLGGYIKMYEKKNGENNNQSKGNEYFYSKSLYQQIVIVLAGPFFSFLFSFLIYWIIFMIGFVHKKPIIEKVYNNSIASVAKLTSGMELKSINGIKTPDWNEVRIQLANRLGSNEVKIKVVKLGSIKEELKVISLDSKLSKLGQKDLIAYLGIKPLLQYVSTVISDVESNSLAEKIGFKIGDKIIKVNDQLIYFWQNFIDEIQKYNDQNISVQVERDGKYENIVFPTNFYFLKKSSKDILIGLKPSIYSFPKEFKNTHQYSILEAMIVSFKKTYGIIFLTTNMLIKLIKGEISLSYLSGPISIAKGVNIAVNQGLIYYLTFLALISINLGVFNLFPIPILDGGHVLFLLIENIIKKPIPKKIKNFSYQISFIFLMLLTGMAIFNDLIYY